MFRVGEEVKVTSVDLPTTGGAGLVTSITTLDDFSYVITVQFGGKRTVQRPPLIGIINQETNKE